ncbi:MAG TPA: DMT family transporter [Thermotogota bacterium]|nr:DMT family transporter [Thermotogota bacterium]HRW34603.1 DMT family transporter [Thermotogota bacterium]
MKYWEKTISNKVSSSLIAIGCAALWGSAFPVLKVAYREFGIEQAVSGRILLAGIRFFLAAMLLFLFSMKSKESISKLGWKHIAYLLLLGIFQTTLQYYFFYNGLANTTGIKASVLASSGTFFMVLLAHFAYTDDKLSPAKLIGLITGLAGIVLVNWGKDFSWSFTLKGEGFLIFTGIANAVGTVIAKKMAKDIHPFRVSAFQMLFGSVLLMIIAYSSEEKPMLQFTALGGWLLIYSAFLSAIAFGMWYALLKYHKAGEITIFKFIIPVSGSILSAIFLPEEFFSFSIIVALSLVSVGIFSVNKKRE